MLKKVHILFFLLSIGLFLAPSFTYACGHSTEKIPCEKENSVKHADTSCQKDCCKSTSDTKKDQHGCKGRCDRSSCTTTAFQFSMLTTNEFEFNNNLFNFSLKKVTTYHKTTGVSDGFTSIWSPPKIS